jgi:hypothetical protein
MHGLPYPHQDATPVPGQPLFTRPPGPTCWCMTLHQWTLAQLSHNQYGYTIDILTKRTMIGRYNTHATACLLLRSIATKHIQCTCTRHTPQHVQAIQVYTVHKDMGYRSHGTHRASTLDTTRRQNTITTTTSYPYHSP